MRVHFSGWTLDSDARELRRGEQSVHLSPKAFRLLEALIECRPAALSKEKLFEIVWPNTFVAESNLASVIKEIRGALQDDARQSTLIRTVFGYGYAFSGEATVETSPMKVESVAVLPFANASGSDWDYVSDGIAEAVLNAIAKLRSVRVVPRSTSFRYRAANVDVKAAAREMRVEAIVAGKIAARGDELTIQAELIDTTSDSQLWGGRFHGKTSELLQLQRQIESDITIQIAERIGTPGESAAATPKAEAYHLYLRGRHQLNRRDAEGFRRAIDAFRTASEMDTHFAIAHAALAEAYVSLGTRETFPPSEIFPLARAAAERALAVDPTLAAAHSAIAGVQELFEWEWIAAEVSHRTAVSLDPLYSTAAQWFALHFARRGQHAEAKRWIDRAVQLEPLSPIINTNAGLISYLAHDFVTAAEQSERALELVPHYEAALVIGGVSNIQVNVQRAISQLEEAAHLSARQTYTLSNLAFALAAGGRRADARAIRDEMRTAAATRYVSPAQIAIAELAIGEKDAALAAFESAADQHSPWLSYALSDPRLDPLRDRPQFRSIIDAVGYGRHA